MQEKEEEKIIEENIKEKEEKIKEDKKEEKNDENIKEENIKEEKEEKKLLEKKEEIKVNKLEEKKEKGEKIEEINNNKLEEKISENIDNSKEEDPKEIINNTECNSPKNISLEDENNNKEINIKIINDGIKSDTIENNKKIKEESGNIEIKNEKDINKNNINIINNINIDNKYRINNPMEEKEDNKYNMRTFNYRFTHTRQYYKNKNMHRNKLSEDFTFNNFTLNNKDNFPEKINNIEGKNIFTIYNMPDKSRERGNSNKPTDLIEPNNLYYLRQDIRICNQNVENKQIYSNLQKKIKRMLTNTKIPIFNFDNYKIIKTIGEGTYGQLYSVINIHTKKTYAMKKLIATDINYFFQCLNSLGINYHNKHSNILDIYGIYVMILEEKCFVIYALMDLSEGDWEKEIRRRKELHKYYKEQELVLIIRQLVSALSFLQKRNIAHRDIKLENILLFPNKIKDKNSLVLDKVYKIGDFGEAKNKIKYSVILNTIRGTDYYMSPELLEGINKQKDFIKNNPHKSDVFSLGLCMMIASTLNYEIISSIRNPKTQVELNKIVRSVIEKRYSKKFSDLITKMLVNNENNRIDFINLEREIRRKYF